MIKMKFQDIKNDLEKMLKAQLCASPISLEESERVKSWADGRYQDAMRFYRGDTQRSSLGWINAIEDTFSPEMVNTPEKARTAFMDSISVYLFYDAKDRLVDMRKEMEKMSWNSQASLIQHMTDTIDNPNETKFEIFWDRGGYGFRLRCDKSSSQSGEEEMRDRVLQETRVYREKNPIIDKNYLRKIAAEKQQTSNSFDPYMEKGVYICLGRGYDAAIRNTDETNEIVRYMISQTTKKTFADLGIGGSDKEMDGPIGPRYFTVVVTGDLKRDVVSFGEMDIVAGPFRNENEARLAAPFVFEERYFKKEK